jgi:hypothetical protein
MNEGTDNQKEIKKFVEISRFRKLEFKNNPICLGACEEETDDKFLQFFDPKRFRVNIISNFKMEIKATLNEIFIQGFFKCFII